MTTAPRPCAYLGAYDCRCGDDYPAGCIILQHPPGTFPLRAGDD